MHKIDRAFPADTQLKTELMLSWTSRSKNSFLFLFKAGKHAVVVSFTPIQLTLPHIMDLWSYAWCQLNSPNLTKHALTAKRQTSRVKQSIAILFVIAVGRAVSRSKNENIWYNDRIPKRQPELTDEDKDSCLWLPSALSRIKNNNIW